MKNRALPLILVLLALVAAAWWWWGGSRADAPQPVVAHPGEAPAVTPVPASSGVGMVGTVGAMGAVDMAHFAFDDLLAAWRVPAPPSREGLMQDPVMAAVRRPRVPGENATDLLARWRSAGAHSEQDALDMAEALSFCERVQTRTAREDVLPEHQQRCEGLEPGDWLARSEALRTLIDAGHVEARLLYQSVGPLGRVSMDDEIIATLGEERAQNWGREVSEHLLHYVRDGGALPFIALGVLSDMHGIAESKVFGNQYDPELAYAYAYLRAASLLAQPPSGMRPEAAARMQEGSVGQLRRMEEALGVEQIAAARGRARIAANALMF